MAKTHGHEFEEIPMEDIFDEDFYHLQMADKELQEAIDKKAKTDRSRHDCYGKAYDKATTSRTMAMKNRMARSLKSPTTMALTRAMAMASSMESAIKVAITTASATLLRL